MSNTITATWFNKTPSQANIKRVKHFIFLVCLIPFLRYFWLRINDDLTANPIEFLERSTGYWALTMLLLTLSLTPLKVLLHKAWLIQLRRMMGLFMFFYAVLHITVYVYLDYSFLWLDIYKDIIKHPYVIVGFLAFVLSVPLALTSNNRSIKHLGKRWKTLHQSVYLIAILGVTHFWWLVKKDIREPLLFATILTVLLLFRIREARKKRIASMT